MQTLLFSWQFVSKPRNVLKYHDTMIFRLYRRALTLTGRESTQDSAIFKKQNNNKKNSLHFRRFLPFRKSETWATCHQFWSWRRNQSGLIWTATVRNLRSPSCPAFCSRTREDWIISRTASSLAVLLFVRNPEVAGRHEHARVSYFPSALSFTCGDLFFNVSETCLLSVSVRF